MNQPMDKRDDVSPRQDWTDRTLNHLAGHMWMLPIKYQHTSLRPFARKIISLVQGFQSWAISKRTED